MDLIKKNYLISSKHKTANKTCYLTFIFNGDK